MDNIKTIFSEIEQITEIVESSFSGCSREYAISSLLGVILINLNEWHPEVYKETIERLEKRFK